MQITNNEHISSDNAPDTAEPFRLSVAFPWCQREFIENDTVGACMIYRAICVVVLRMVPPSCIYIYDAHSMYVYHFVTIVMIIDQPRAKYHFCKMSKIRDNL